MGKISVQTREGVLLKISATSGSSIMEIIRDGGVDELLALCGGSCSCATCHIYIDPDDVTRLPNMLEDEAELLEGSLHRTEISRLSCQIRFTEGLDELRVTIAPED